MHLIDLAALPLETITHFSSQGAESTRLAGNDGETHVYWLRFEAGGSIGLHRAGFDQLFVPVTGSGWVMVEGSDRCDVGVGQAAVFKTGEVHAKGSDVGLQAMMVQLTEGDLVLLSEVLPGDRERSS